MACSDCVLDEIEAALDDVNVFRYAEYLKKFTEHTQFLVITHRKGTMEVADTVYGVTMVGTEGRYPVRGCQSRKPISVRIGG